jgi:hypothetical protein
MMYMLQAHMLQEMFVTKPRWRERSTDADGAPVKAARAAISIREDDTVVTAS